MDQAKKLEEELSRMVYDDWLNNQLFTWQWWLLLALTIIPWFVWWRLVDKNRKLEIFAYGLFIGIISSFLDVLGWNRHLWTYPIQFLPICTPLLPMDITLLPVSNMLVYQYFNQWKSFFGMNIIAACFYAFVSEPILEWMDIYKRLNWKYVYSVPIYISIALLGKWLINKMKNP